MLDWKSSRPIWKEFYGNDTDKGGKPDIDWTAMIKTLFLQNVYSCSDEVMSIGLYNRVDFRNFLRYPKIRQDSKTIWHFREHL